MVENDAEVIYEEIVIHKPHLHERNRSAPDIIPHLHERSRSAPDITPLRSLKHKSATLLESRRGSQLHKIYLDTKYRLISNASLNEAKAYEIYDDQPVRTNSTTLNKHDLPFLNEPERANSDTSIYISMTESNLVNTPMESDTSTEIYNNVSMTESPAIESLANESQLENSQESDTEFIINGDMDIDNNEQVYGNFSQYIKTEHTLNGIVPQENATNSNLEEIYDNFSPPKHSQHMQTEQRLKKHHSLRSVHSSDMYSHISNHNRGTSSSSSGCSSLIEASSPPFTSRSAEELARKKYDDDEETIYAEIVTKNKVLEITTARITRESDNPILRSSLVEDFSDFVKPASSLNNLDNECIYGEIAYVKPKTKVYQTRSMDRKRPQSLHIHRTKHLKSISTFSPLASANSTTDVYENSVRRSSPVKHNDTISKLNYRHSFADFRMIDNNENNADISDISFYENIDIDEKYYENVSDNDSDLMRDRKHSRPIDIISTMPRNQSGEVLYSDVEFKKTSHPFSNSSSSVASSPRGSTCSSMSSDHSVFAGNSASPPPLPSTRKRMERYASWGNVNAFSGLNYFPAHYLGRHPAPKVTREYIDFAISHVAQNTNVLEMKPILAEISHDFVRFGSNTSPWELLVSFPVEEVIRYDVTLKNAYFIGIIAGAPGEEAYCYVLQSDKAIEINDAIHDIFQTVSKMPRSQTLEFTPSIEPEFHCYHNLIKIGCIKVKKSFHNVNDYVKLILEKVNPKEFKGVSVELLGQNIVIKETNTEEELSHSSPSILTLGVYEDDKRYFGYIISEMMPGSKTRVQCHVYRAARNQTATKIVAAISQSCQNSYAPRRTSNCDINPIYSSSYKAVYTNVTPRSSIASSTSSWSMSTTPCPSSPTSPTSESSFSVAPFIRRQSSEVEDSYSSNERRDSTETMLTITPSPSTDQLMRSSPVTSLKRRSESGISQTLSSHDENPIYQKTTEMKLPDVIETDGKVSGTKKHKHKKLLGKLRHSIKHMQASHHVISPTEKGESNLLQSTLEEIEPEVVQYSASYVCSTVVSPPLKHKHVKECYKQYNKQMHRAGKLTNNNTNSTGSSINLQIITNQGVYMLDPNQPDTVIRHFPIDTFELYMQHPEDIGCFGFSTTVPGNIKEHKCHLFCVNKEYLRGVGEAFQKMTKLKKLMGL